MHSTARFWGHLQTASQRRSRTSTRRRHAQRCALDAHHTTFITGSGQSHQHALQRTVLLPQLLTAIQQCEPHCKRCVSYSTHTLTDAQPDFSVCQLNDVLLFNGSIYYVTSNPKTVSMPDVNLDWLSSGNLTKNQTDYNRYVAGTVECACMVGMCGNGWMRLVCGCTALNAASLHPPARMHQPSPLRGLLKSYLKVVTPSQLRALGALPTTIVDEAIFLHFIFYFNYYHVFSEYAPTLHNVVCKYWGKCRCEGSVVLSKGVACISLCRLCRLWTPCACCCACPHCRYDPAEKLRIFLTSNWDTHWDHLWLKSLVSPDFIRFVTLQPVVNVRRCGCFFLCVSRASTDLLC